MSDTKTWKTLDWSTATVDDVQQIIENGGQINQEVSSVSGAWREETWVVRSPLAFATEAENENVVAFLLRNGANPNQVVRNTNHYWGEVNVKPLPLLTLAIETGNQRIIDLYFKHGVNPYDIGEKETEETDPCRKHFQQYEYEEQVISWTHPLTVAISKGNKKVMNKILKEYEIPGQQKKIFQRVFSSRIEDAEKFQRQRPEHDLYKLCLSYWKDPTTEIHHEEAQAVRPQEPTVSQQENGARVSAVQKFLGKIMIWGEAAKQWIDEAKVAAEKEVAARKAREAKQKGGNE